MGGWPWATKPPGKIGKGASALSFSKHYFADVLGLGNVAVSRHAQEQAAEHGISEDVFQRVLERGTDRPDGLGVVWREDVGIRLVIILRPAPFRGAALVTTLYPVKRQASARK